MLDETIRDASLSSVEEPDIYPDSGRHCYRVPMEDLVSIATVPGCSGEEKIECNERCSFDPWGTINQGRMSNI